MNLYLARHGETRANRDGVYCGVSDLPLTQQGRWQAHRVAWQLADIPFGRVLTSRLRRSRETAAILCPGTAPEAWPEWDEMNFGEWELRHHRDLRAQDPVRYAAWCDDWQHAPPPGGEGFQEFARRVERASARLRGQADDGNILLVAHQGVLGVLLATLLGLPPTAMWHFPFRQDAFTQVRLDHGFCVLNRLNDGGRATMPAR
ncbi:histidine phosphatase family protein [Acerihabitans arboris]|uniref:Alpha-ribazole phosphatase n=1 Tax=Acerihabitans arboris TaxID=2691583 RepID=A0A845SH28_9GAMM|nr:histidine phosphatase family protein [Acerihabitans arboris]NDL63169.1 alpha-ribazole phosphatase [Acerihabitans arboris]